MAESDQKRKEAIMVVQKNARSTLLDCSARSCDWYTHTSDPSFLNWLFHFKPTSSLVRSIVNWEWETFQKGFS